MSKPAGANRERRWDSLVLWGFLGSLALIRAGHMEERDPYWQIRAGIENLAGVPLARPDTWTWSGVEGNWYPNSPLWNILLAYSYQLGSFWGFFVLSATSIVLLMVIVNLLGRRLGSRPLPGLLGLLVVMAAAYSMLNARATLAVQVVLLFAVYVALRISDRAGAAPVFALTTGVTILALGLSTLGNWLHLSFLLLGPAMAVVWALIWMLTSGLTAGRRWALIVGGGFGWALGTLMSPYGVATGLARSRAVQDACEGIITEWMSPFDTRLPPRLVLISSVMLVVALVLAAGTGWWLRRRWRAGQPVRELAALAMIGVPAAVAGLVAIRFLGVSLLMLSPVAAAAATRAVDWLRLRMVAWPASVGFRARLQDYSSGRFWRIVLSATLVVLSPGLVVLAGQHGEPPERAFAAQLPAGCNLFSAPGIGGSVVLLRPDVPVWMDGRADFFGRDMLILTSAYLGGTAQRVVPDGTRCILLDVTDGLTLGLLRGLRSSPEWILQAAGKDLELWVPAQAGRG